MKKIIILMILTLIFGCSLFETEGTLTITIPDSSVLVFINSETNPIAFTNNSATVVLESGTHSIISIREGYIPKIETVEVEARETVSYDVVLEQYSGDYLTDFDLSTDISLGIHGIEETTTLNNESVLSISPLANTNNSENRQLKGVSCTYPTAPNTENFSLYIETYFNFIESDQRLFFDFLISPDASSYTAYAFGWDFSLSDQDNITFHSQEVVSGYNISSVSEDFHQISLHVSNGYALFLLDDKLLSITEIINPVTFSEPIRSWFGLENNYEITESSFDGTFIINQILAYY